MSYFKPLNSNENNLHIIRASINSTGSIVTPLANQLPATFSTTYYPGSVIGSITTNASVILNYPSIFNPIDMPIVLIEQNSNTSGTELLVIKSKTNTSCTIFSSTITLPSFDIFIIGTKPSGPVFAVSNRGWKYSTSISNSDIIYSDMLVGVNIDDPTFNLTVTGNIGTTPNLVRSSNIIGSNLLKSYLNIIDLDNSGTISLPASNISGQLIEIVVGNIILANQNLTFNMQSNIFNSSSSNIILQNSGDSVSLCSYNNKWLMIDKNIKPPIVNRINYNQIPTSSFSFNSIVNGLLTLLTLDSNITIDLPVATNYNGIVIELIVANVSVPSSSAILSLTNITTNRTSPITLSNISDKIKLLGNGTTWLII